MANTMSESEVVITDGHHVSVAVNDEDLLSLHTQQVLAAIAQPLSYLLIALLFFGALRKAKRRRFSDSVGGLLPSTGDVPPAAELFRLAKARLFPGPVEKVVDAARTGDGA